MTRGYRCELKKYNRGSLKAYVCKWIYSATKLNNKIHRSKHLWTIITFVLFLYTIHSKWKKSLLLVIIINKETDLRPKNSTHKNYRKCNFPISPSVRHNFLKRRLLHIHDPIGELVHLKRTSILPKILLAAGFTQIPLIDIIREK